MTDLKDTDLRHVIEEVQYDVLHSSHLCFVYICVEAGIYRAGGGRMYNLDDNNARLSSVIVIKFVICTYTRAGGARAQD